MFYKIPKNTDLSKTSYRCYKETNEMAYIEYNAGYVDNDWKEISKQEMESIAPEWFENIEPEPIPDPVMEKLDSIEAKIQTNEDLQTFYDDIVKEVGL